MADQVRASAVYNHSPNNISASQYVNLDAMKERYRRKLRLTEDAKLQKQAERPQVSAVVTTRTLDVGERGKSA